MKNRHLLTVVTATFLLSAIAFSQQTLSKASIQKRIQAVKNIMPNKSSSTLYTSKELTTKIFQKNSNQSDTNPFEIIVQAWDTTGAAWVNYIRILYSVNIDTSISQNWVSSVWENSTRSILSYDINNNLTHSLLQTWSGTDWKDSYMTNYYYDSNNNDTLMITQQWSGSQWTDVSKHINSYDSNHNVLVELNQMWVSTQWFDFTRYTSTYSGNNLISYLAETFNFVSWSKSSFHTYTYDSNNNRITDVYQLWNGSAWTNSSKDTMAYNIANYLTSDLYLSWNGSSWENTSLETDSYDVNNNRIKTLNQDWNSSNWVNRDQDTAGYNVSGYITFDISQGWSGTEWVNEFKYIYNYSGATAIDNNKNTNPFNYYLSNNYPNPFNPTTNIKYSLSSEGFVSLKVYDILGRVVSILVGENQPSGSYTVKFDGSDLSSGIYLYQLKVNGFVSTKKLMLLK